MRLPASRVAALAVPWPRRPVEDAAERIAQIEPARTPWLISKGVDDLDHGLQGAPVQLVYVIRLNGEVRHLRADPPSLAKLNCSRADASSSWAFRPGSTAALLRASDDRAVILDLAHQWHSDD